ncbi:MAG: PstS family phosphate ABC transporter substrate-binding protein [Deltaproteobacteria bacterium]
MRRMRWFAMVAAVLAIALVGVACGGDEPSDGGSGDGTGLSGDIRIDGSSTVGPLTEAAAEFFQMENPDVRVTVGISGTGGGFEKFCAEETDANDASRQIEADEEELCATAGVEWVEMQVANDGIAVVINPENDWADSLTVEQLKTIWNEGSTIDNWNQVDPSFPDVPLELFGPGTDSGTFDYFTDAINGEEGVSRTDYQATEDDNVAVQGVAGSKGGMAYFGLSYYEQNADKLKVVAIDGGSGPVTPSLETVQSGEYTPLSRPLFIYPSVAALQRPEMAAFMQFYLDNAQSIAEQAQFVPITAEQTAAAQSVLDGIIGGASPSAE